MASPYEQLKRDYDELQRDFRIAHDTVLGLQAQVRTQDERNAALVKEAEQAAGGSFQMIVNDKTVDDSTVSAVLQTKLIRRSDRPLSSQIKGYASSLDRQINSWAGDLVQQFERRELPSQRTEQDLLAAPLLPLVRALLSDIPEMRESAPASQHISEGLSNNPRAMLHAYCRHAFAVVLCEDMVNAFFVTDSPVVNQGLAEIHAALLKQLPKPAAVWRLQTFKVAKENLDPGTLKEILTTRLPAFSALLSPLPPPLLKLLEGARLFGRMVHGSKDPVGGFYTAFVPALGESLDNSRMELLRRCARIEAGTPEVCGACLYPGLIKIVPLQNGQTQQTVIKRAIVSCECAIMPRSMSSQGSTMKGNPVAPAYESHQSFQKVSEATPGNHRPEPSHHEPVLAFGRPVGATVNGHGNRRPSTDQGSSHGYPPDNKTGHSHGNDRRSATESCPSSGQPTENNLRYSHKKQESVQHGSSGDVRNRGAIKPVAQATTFTSIPDDLWDEPEGRGHNVNVCFSSYLALIPPSPLHNELHLHCLIMSNLPEVTDEQRFNMYSDKHLQPREPDVNVLESQQSSPPTPRKGGLSKKTWIFIAVGAVLALAAIVGGAVAGSHKSKNTASFFAPFTLIPSNNSTSTSYYSEIASITLPIPVTTDSKNITHFSTLKTTVQLQPTLSPVQTFIHNSTAVRTKLATVFDGTVTLPAGETIAVHLTNPGNVLATLSESAPQVQSTPTQAASSGSTNAALAPVPVSPIKSPDHSNTTPSAYPLEVAVVTIYTPTVVAPATATTYDPAFIGTVTFQPGVSTVTGLAPKIVTVFDGTAVNQADQSATVLHFVSSISGQVLTTIPAATFTTPGTDPSDTNTTPAATPRRRRL
ncbi:hypothetical protein P7C70_g3744, partial [Phenoliferia sp. Uapishka_3]